MPITEKNAAEEEENHQNKQMQELRYNFNQRKWQALPPKTQ